MSKIIANKKLVAKHWFIKIKLFQKLASKTDHSVQFKLKELVKEYITKMDVQKKITCILKIKSKKTISKQCKRGKLYCTRKSKLYCKSKKIVSKKKNGHCIRNICCKKVYNFKTKIWKKIKEILHQKGELQKS